MSERTVSPPRIVASSYRITRSVQGQRRLEILWRFENQSSLPAYVLLDRPLATTIAEPLILDHSSSQPPIPIEANRSADFEIVTVSPGGGVDRWRQYQLALPEGLEGVTVVGRFGYSYAAPDPAWVKDQNRVRVEQWQQITHSERLSVRFGTDG